MKGISNFITFIICVGIVVVGIIQPAILAKNDVLTSKLLISNVINCMFMIALNVFMRKILKNEMEETI